MMGRTQFIKNKTRYLPRVAAGYPTTMRMATSTTDVRLLPLDMVDVASGRPAFARDILAARQALVLNGPGSGKTGFVNVAVQTDLLQVDSLPLPLKLRYVDRVIDSAQALACIMARQEIAESVGEEFFAQALREGNAHLIFDGLDEVPTERRAAQIEGFGRIMSEAGPNTRLLVTGRSEGYDGGFGEGVNVFRLKGLMNEGVDRFVGAYYAGLKNMNGSLVFTEDSHGQRACSEQAEAFLVAMRSSELYARALRAPVLLPLACKIFYDGGNPQQGKLGAFPSGGVAGLLATFTPALAQRFKFFQRIERSASKRELMPATTEAVFAELAFWAHSQGVLDFSVAEVESALSKMRTRIDDPAAYALDMVSFDELFVPARPDRYSFAHLTFQEAFCASKIAEGGDAEIVAFLKAVMTNDRMYNSAKYALGSLLVKAPNRARAFVDQIIEEGQREEAFYKFVFMFGEAIFEADVGLHFEREIGEKIKAHLPQFCTSSESAIRNRALVIREKLEARYPGLFV